MPGRLAAASFTCVKLSLGQQKLSTSLHPGFAMAGCQNSTTKAPSIMSIPPNRNGRLTRSFLGRRIVQTTTVTSRRTGVTPPWNEFHVALCLSSGGCGQEFYSRFRMPQSLTSLRPCIPTPIPRISDVSGSRCPSCFSQEGWYQLLS